MLWLLRTQLFCFRCCYVDDADYVPITTSFSFIAEAQADCVLINITNDAVTEPPESFTIEVNRIRVATVFILDSECKCICLAIGNSTWHTTKIFCLIWRHDFA